MNNKELLKITQDLFRSFEKAKGEDNVSLMMQFCGAHTAVCYLMGIVMEDEWNKFLEGKS